jgi:hypothetical protein
MTKIENKMKTLEEIAEEFLIRQGCQRMCCNDPECNGVGDFFEDVQPKDLIEFSKLQQERMYSEEDMRKAFIAGGNSCIEEDDVYGSAYKAYMKKWFEQFKKK